MNGIQLSKRWYPDLRLLEEVADLNQREFGLRAFSGGAHCAPPEKAHFCVRIAHAKMGTSAYPELTLIRVISEPLFTKDDQRLVYS